MPACTYLDATCRPADLAHYRANDAGRLRAPAAANIVEIGLFGQVRHA